MMATTLNPKERNLCMECAEEKHLNNEEIKKEFENLKHWKALLLEVDESIVEDLKKREWKFIEKSINSTREEVKVEIMEKKRKYGREYVKKLRADKKKKGICKYCKKKTVNKTHCEFHRKQWNDYRKKEGD